jgi:type II secretory pathway pseudopilin PulG
MRERLRLQKVVSLTKYLFLRREVLVSGKTKNNKGSTLIEIVIVSFVVTIALVALTNLTMISVSRNRQSKEAAVATKLAQEGIEWFKGQRNNMGYEQFSLNIIPDTPTTPYCVNTSADLITAISLANDPLINPDCLTNTTYYRWFTFNNDSLDAVIVGFCICGAARQNCR